jgi:hypothetical protein
VELLRLEAIFSCTIEKFPALKLASILLKEASEGGHLLLGELLRVREHAIELWFHLFLSSLLLLNSLLLLFLFFQLSFFGFLALPLLFSLFLSFLDSLVLKDFQPSLKISAFRSQHVNLLFESSFQR